MIKSADLKAQRTKAHDKRYIFESIGFILLKSVLVIASIIPCCSYSTYTVLTSVAGHPFFAKLSLRIVAFYIHFQFTYARN